MSFLLAAEDELILAYNSLLSIGKLISQNFTNGNVTMLPRIDHCYDEECDAHTLHFFNARLKDKKALPPSTKAPRPGNSHPTLRSYRTPGKSNAKVQVVVFDYAVEPRDCFDRVTEKLNAAVKEKL